MMVKYVDLNCDMGESFGAWRMGQDQALIAHISSANIACGFHAGDPASMRKTVALAVEHGVQIGAHPGLPDLMGFGRREMQLSAQQAYDLMVVQIGALQAVAHTQGACVKHVKAHGALYNMAARDMELAGAIAQAVKDIDPHIQLYGLAGSQLVSAAQGLGLCTVQEVFADRAYQADGSLVPRQHPQAMLATPEQALEQVLSMVLDGRVKAIDGAWVVVQADTICLHGDQPGALEFAQFLRQGLRAQSIQLRAFSAQ